MSGDVTIEEAASELIDRPRPVLCLDTCDLLDVVRAFAAPGNLNDEMARRMLDALEDDPARFQLVITDLVRREWGQNLARVEAQAANDLRSIIDRAARVAESLVHARISPQRAEPEAPNPLLVRSLVGMAEDLIRRSMVLRQDELCVKRALDRVLEKRPPSRHGAIKDSLHLEHYLELARVLGRSHFPEPCVFVSGNSADFGNGPLRPHQDLVEDFAAAGLQFFGKLEAVIGLMKL